MLKELVENFYFTENEAKVYLAALQLGRSRVSGIAKKAELNRITAYEILKRLVQMGVAHSAMYSGVQTFTVIAPDMLVEKMESRLKVAQQILPQLGLFDHSNSVKPKIGFFEGIEGIRTLYEDTLTSKDRIIYNIANPENLMQTIGKNFFDQYVKKRFRRKIIVKVLLPDSAKVKKYEKETKSSLREIKYFDAKKFDVPNEILIYDNKVALLSFSSLMGVLVEDKDITKSVLAFWQMAWMFLK